MVIARNPRIGAVTAGRRSASGPGSYLGFWIMLCGAVTLGDLGPYVGWFQAVSPSPLAVARDLDRVSVTTRTWVRPLRNDLAVDFLIINWRPRGSLCCIPWQAGKPAVFVCLCPTSTMCMSTRSKIALMVCG